MKSENCSLAAAYDNTVYSEVCVMDRRSNIWNGPAHTGSPPTECPYCLPFPRRRPLSRNKIKGLFAIHPRANLRAKYASSGSPSKEFYVSKLVPPHGGQGLVHVASAEGLE